MQKKGGMGEGNKLTKKNIKTVLSKPSRVDLVSRGVYFVEQGKQMRSITVASTKLAEYVNSAAILI